MTRRAPSVAAAQVEGVNCFQRTDDGWRIDQVLAHGASVDSCRVLRQAGDLSDHWPLVAEVMVP